MKATWKVAVVYEDAAAREVAVAFCDRLVERFWSQAGFDVGWWSFELLETPDAAQAATEKAAQADLVVFALGACAAVPMAVQAWAEDWVGQRQEREGAVVALLQGLEEGGGAASERHSYLRQLAHRAEMDYLTQVPQSVLHSIPDSSECCSERAREVTSVLDEILQQHPRPPTLPA